MEQGDQDYCNCHCHPGAIFESNDQIKACKKCKQVIFNVDLFEVGDVVLREEHGSSL